MFRFIGTMWKQAMYCHHLPITRKLAATASYVLRIGYLPTQGK